MLIAIAAMVQMAGAAPVVAEYVLTTDVTNATADIEFRQLPEGLLIWSRLEPPSSIMLPASLPDFPAFAWFSHFGFQGPEPGQTNAEYCDKKQGCLEWIQRSQQRRVLLRRLLERHYVLRGGSYRETRAADAFTGQPDAEVAPALRSRAAPRVILNAGTYAVLLPWEALPAQRDLTFSRQQIRLAMPSGATHSFEVDLARPRRYHYSACYLPLLAVTDRTYMQDAAPAFYFPQRADLIETVFGWSQPFGERGWDANGVAPSGLSPQVRMQRSTFFHLGGDEYICGPMLKYRNGPAETATGEALRNGNWKDLYFDERAIAAARVEGAGILVLQKPYWRAFHVDGGGYCGSAPVIWWKVLHIAPLPPQRGVYYDRIHKVAAAQQMLYCAQGAPADYDVEFSADLRKITEYQTFDEPEGGSQQWQARVLTWDGKAFGAGTWHPSAPPAGKGFRRRIPQ